MEQSQQIKNNLTKLIRLMCKEMGDTLSRWEVWGDAAGDRK